MTFSDFGPVIDTHGHCVPTSFLDDVAASSACGVTVEQRDDGYVVTLPGGQPLRPVRGVMTDGEGRRAWMDKQHVTHQIVAPWLDLQGQELAARDGVMWAGLLNDHLAATVARTPWLSAHATVHLGDPESAAAELHRAVSRLEMRSVMVPCTLPNRRLSDPALDPFWAAAADLRTPVILHATTRSPAAELLDRFPDLKGLFGRHIETSLVTAELIVNGVLDRFPALRLVNVHGGGILPYQLGRFDHDTTGSVARLPSDVLRTMYYDSVLLTPAALRYLVDVMGTDRVILGSDYGATPAERAGVSVIEPALTLGPDAVDAVLFGTASELFGLSGR